MNARSSPSAAVPRSSPTLARRRRLLRAAIDAAVRPGGAPVESLERRQLLSGGAFLSTGQVIVAGGANAPAITGTLKSHDDGGGGKGRDQTAPLATVSAPDVTAGGGTTATVTVVYRDDVGVRRSKIGKSDLRVSPGLSVKDVSVDRGDDGSPLVAVYTLAARGGQWGREDNGTYSVSVKAGEVSDTAGNAVAETTAAFAVSIADSSNEGSGGGSVVGEPATEPVPAPAPADTTPPTAAVSAANVTAGGGATHAVSVTYTDDLGLDPASVGADDIAVTGGGGAGGPVAVTAFSVAGAGTSLTATYTLAAPGGAWDLADNGTYAVTVNAGAVRDLAGNGSAQAAGTFQVAVPPPPDTTSPTAAISAPDVVAATVAPHAVTVVYSDDVAIDASTIGRSDLRVSKAGPGADLTVGDPTVTPAGNGSPLTVTYPVTGPGGSWLAGDNGTYQVSLRPDAVRDTSGNAVAAASVTFQVNIPVPDTTGPTVAIAAAGITSAGGTGQVVTVTYTDAGGFDDTSFGADDIAVSGPAGGLAVTGFAAGGAGNARTVIYTVAAPGGAWDSADNGTYAVAVNAGAVRDAAGNANAAASGTFGVNIAAPPPPPPPQDTTPPGVASIGAPDVTAPGASGTTVTVVFNDDVALDAATISTDDLTVTRDGDGATLVVTGVTRSPDANAASLTATFSVAAPGGSWDAADNGTYTVSFAGDVRDTSGNAAAAARGSFRVDVPAADAAGPAVSISAPNIITAGNGKQTVTVVFADPSGVVRSSIDRDAITVAAPGGASLNVRNVSVSPDADGTSLTATYTLDAPQGGWRHDDNGTYTITLLAGRVRDAAGNATGEASATFTVSIDAPQQPDTAAPTVTSITAPDLTNATAGQTVTVVYGDDRGIDLSSIDAGDLTVTGPGGGTLTVGGVVTSGGGTSVTAVYTIAGPGGSFAFADNGAYTVTLNAGQVRDTAGNAAAGGATAAFQVNVTRQDGRAPTADAVSAAGVSLAGGNTQDVVVTYSDDLGIDLESVGADDVTVTRPGGGSVPIDNVRIGGSGASVTVTYTLTPPGGTWDAGDNGTYSVVVNAGKVKDASGKGVGRATGSFVVSVPDPGPADPDFAGGEAVAAPFTIEAIANQADGRILAAGRQGSVGAGAQAVIQRFNADGTLDATFGAAGKLVADGDEAYYAVAALTDGHVLAAGTRNGDFVVARYDSAGKLDTSFGEGGRVTIDFGTAEDGAYSLAIAPDGKIVLGGSSDGNFAFARLDSSGALDVSFAQGGKQLFDMGSTDEIGALLVQGDGKTVAAGSSGTGIIILRLGADGEADTSFSGDGVLVVPGLAARDDPSLPERSVGLAAQPDGKFLLANRTPTGDFGLARIDPSGNLDSGFGSNGIAAADFGGTDDADAVLVQEAGQILVVGTTDAGGGTPKTGVAAFDPSGALIGAFGQGGKLTLDAGLTSTDPGRELHVGDLVLRAFGTRQSDGRLVIATSNQSPATTNSALRKLRVPGSQAVSTGAAIGTFGMVDGKRTKLTFTDDDGTVVTITLNGGTGTVYKAGDKLRIVLNADAKGATLKLSGKGGDGRVNLSDVVVNGTLKSLTGKTANLAGTLCATGAIGKLTLADVLGGTIAAGGGSIASLNALSLDKAYVLSGAALGSDGKLGGDGADADSFARGSIGTIKIKGNVTACVIGAGLNPTDGVFLDGDDTVVDGPASNIKSITARNIDDATKIVAGSIRSAASPRKIKALDEDGRFLLM